MVKESQNENKLNVIKNQSTQNQETKTNLKEATGEEAFGELFRIYFISHKDQMEGSKNQGENRIKETKDGIRKIENVQDKDTEVNKITGIP